MISWTLVVVAVVLVLGGLFAVLVVFSLSRSASGGDLEWQIARLERKVELILTHLGIGHDEHVPEPVIKLARDGRTQEAVREYARLTGVSESVARREVEFVEERLKQPKAGPAGDDRG